MGLPAGTQLGGYDGVARTYVQPYPGPGGKWQISTEGGTEPMWNPNGRELFYRVGENPRKPALRERIGFITFNQPKVLNALNRKNDGRDIHGTVNHLSAAPVQYPSRVQNPQWCSADNETDGTRMSPVG